MFWRLIPCRLSFHFFFNGFLCCAQFFKIAFGMCLLINSSTGKSFYMLEVEPFVKEKSMGVPVMVQW